MAIPGPNLLKENFPRLPLLRGLALEGVANRDSLSYLPQYGLPADLPTILRGTLRYPGFSRVVDAFKRLGLLDTSPLSQGLESPSTLLEACLRAKGHATTDGPSRQQALLAVLEGDEALATETLAVLQESVPVARRLSVESSTDSPMSFADSASRRLGGPPLPLRTWSSFPRPHEHRSTTSPSSSRSGSSTVRKSATLSSLRTK